MNDYILYSDEKLMKEIKADNMLAFDVLYKKYSKRLYNFGYSILKSQAEAENLLQDVFLNLWEKRHNLEKDSSVKSFVFTIAYNTAVSIMRKKAREQQFFDYLKTLQDLNQDPVNIEIEYNELNDKLNSIINKLPARQREVYLLHKNKGLKYQEIAERLNISVNTVENHMSRALKIIRAGLADYSIIVLLFLFLFV